jgi:hypothetical protein
MKKILGILTGLLLLASPVFATTYYLRIDGSDGNPGTSWSTAWRTIGKANHATLPGDKVYVYDTGSNYYSDTSINPDSAGSNPTGGGFITFIGASLDGDCLTDSTIRSRVKVFSCSTIKPYVSIKGIHFLCGLFLDQGSSRDSVQYCNFDRGYGLAHTDYNYIAWNSFQSQYGSIDDNGTYVLGHAANSKCIGNKIFYNHMWDVGKVLFTSANLFYWGQTVPIGDPTPHGYVDSTSFWFNTVDFTIQPTSVTGDWTSATKFFHTSNSTIKYCRLTFTNNDTREGTGDCPSSLSLVTIRDSTMHFAFIGDTLLALGPAFCQQIITSSGNLPGTMADVDFDSCLVQGEHFSFVYFEPMNGNDLLYNTLATHTGHIFIKGPVPAVSVIDHNTLVGDTKLGILQLWDNKDFGSSLPYNSLTVTNNIFQQGTSSTQFTSCKPGNLAQWDLDWGVFYGNIAFWQNRLFTQYNLYNITSYTTAIGDRNIGWYNNGYFCSTSGSGGAWNAVTTVKGGDSLSVVGSVDPLINKLIRPINWNPTTSYFDPRLGVGSPAIGVGSSGSDVGSTAHTGSPQVELASASFPTMLCITCVDSSVTYKIHNIGTATLILNNFVFETSAGGVFSADSTTYNIGVDATRNVKVTCAHTPTRDINVGIDLSTNDPILPLMHLAILVNRVSGGGNGNNPDTDQ